MFNKRGKKNSSDKIQPLFKSHDIRLVLLRRTHAHRLYVHAIAHEHARSILIAS
jgi:hypothetical protein